MKHLAPLVAFLFFTPLAAQSLLQELAGEVCDCLSGTEIVYPRLQAGKCTDDVAMAYNGRIQDELHLTVSSDGDRRRLTDLLVDPLAEECEVLRRLAASSGEAESHYSDLHLLQRRARPLAAKHPAADAATAVIREVAHPRWTGGEAVEVRRDLLLVRLNDGTLLPLRYQSRQLRRSDISPGDRLEVRYGADWTSEAGRVTWELLEVR